MKKPFILLALLAFTLSTMHAQSFPVNIVSLKQQYSLPFNSYYIWIWQRDFYSSQSQCRP